MIRRIESWQRALWIGLALVLAHAAPAHALVTIQDTPSATFQWAPASGPVVGYYVFLDLGNGTLTRVYTAVIGRNSVTINHIRKDMPFRVRVQAFDAAGNGSALSDPSEEIVFASAPPAVEDPPAVDDPPDMIVYFAGNLLQLGIRYGLHH